MGDEYEQGCWQRSPKVRIRFFVGWNGWANKGMAPYPRGLAGACSGRRNGKCCVSMLAFEPQLNTGSTHRAAFLLDDAEHSGEKAIRPPTYCAARLAQKKPAQ